MDTNQFDDLTMALAEGESRRSLLRRLFISGAIAVGTASGLERVASAARDEVQGDAKNSRACRQSCRRKKNKQQRRRCRQRCKQQTECKRNPHCIDPLICVDGACTGGWSCVTDSQCIGGQSCIGGRCTGGGTCANANHCRSGQTCVNGTCQGIICPAVTRTACANEPGTCGPVGSACVCLQEAAGSRIACSEVGFSDCSATPVCNPAQPNNCPAGWLCVNNPCCPDAPRCLPPCGTAPQRQG
jgi:hypothetical protein